MVQIDSDSALVAVSGCRQRGRRCAFVATVTANWPSPRASKIITLPSARSKTRPAKKHTTPAAAAAAKYRQSRNVAAAAKYRQSRNVAGGAPIRTSLVIPRANPTAAASTTTPNRSGRRGDGGAAA
jgi:hypothetical protein